MARSIMKLPSGFEIGIPIHGDSANLTMTAGIDTGCFRHRYTDFGNTNLGVPKFDRR